MKILNPILLENNPRYLSELQNLPEHERERQLYGNWYARPQGSNYWLREWVRGTNGERVVDRVPSDAKAFRAYDKASSEPSETYRFPDYTACIKIWKDRAGAYYITGDYQPDFKDQDSDVLGRFRKRAGERDKLMLKQAEWDGKDCTIVLPKDPGSAGQIEFQNSAKMFIEEGYIVRQDPTPSQKSKLTRFLPFASACENGLVYIVESTFNKATLEHFYKELESFSGERSSNIRKDDFPDACASAFGAASQQKISTLPRYNQINTDAPTLKANMGL